MLLCGRSRHSRRTGWGMDGARVVWCVEVVSMSTWGWVCQESGCSSKANGDRQRYRSRDAAQVAARAHAKATGHKAKVVEYR